MTFGTTKKIRESAVTVSDTGLRDPWLEGARRGMYKALRAEISAANGKLRRYRSQAQQMDRAHKRVKQDRDRAIHENEDLIDALSAAWDALDVECANELIRKDPERYSILSSIPDILRERDKGRDG